MLTILRGDAIEQLRTLPDESVHCCVTSPPYWSLRDYSCNGQLGLEKTPEEYVAKMVEVFREVRRVLRKDGTLWLNMGDSYAQVGGMMCNDHERSAAIKRATERNYDVSAWGASRRATAAIDRAANTAVSGLKPKDLCGIPWTLAKALQSPYYTGRIKNELDRVWLAAMIDAEGCMFIHKRKAGTLHDSFQKKDGSTSEYLRVKDSFGAGLEVANTSREIVEKCLRIAGVGSICEQTPKQNDRRKQTLYRWNVRSNECKWIVHEVYPYLTSKLQQARILINCPGDGQEGEKCHRSMIALHNGGQACIDYDTPPSLFEKGWYLRSDVIWSKLNPMPESVTDRPTKAHEYLFLLTKSANYFYDAEAIREPKLDPEDDLRRIRKAKSYNTNSGWNVAKVDNWSVDPDSISAGRNKRSVWTVATAPYPEAHFATYPPDLIKPCILAGTSTKGCCAKCGSPWERIVESEKSFQSGSGRAGNMPNGKQDLSAKDTNSTPDVRLGPVVSTKTIGWQPTCKCWPPVYLPRTIPCTVLDPFAGSGTTGAVALELGRKAILIELNPKYVDLIRQRCNITPGLQLA